ncbi:hypothetical protein [Mycoplasma sp. VS410B]|uniref:hypothetical protein n=1 Tax=Mycoplasma sp. VS410B TaxID=3401688 RepID=UPI003AAF4FF3
MELIYTHAVAQDKETGQYYLVSIQPSRYSYTPARTIGVFKIDSDKVDQLQANAQYEDSLTAFGNIPTLKSLEKQLTFKGEQNGN